jgi:hypothetical protein
MDEWMNERFLKSIIGRGEWQSAISAASHETRTHSFCLLWFLCLLVSDLVARVWRCLSCVFFPASKDAKREAHILSSPLLSSRSDPNQVVKNSPEQFVTVDYRYE